MKLEITVDNCKTVKKGVSLAKLSKLKIQSDLLRNEEVLFYTFP